MPPRNPDLHVMARYRFQPGKEYPARLLTVRVRPTENDERVRLLRLEFEIFPEIAGQLRSLGKIACRDLVIGAEPVLDVGVLRYARAAGISREDCLADWLAAAERAPWVCIVFGAPDPEDDRNSFVEINAFDPSTRGSKVVEYDFTVGQKWVTPETAADELDCSTATVRRRVDKHKAEWGSYLVRVSQGGHRRINLALLRELGSKDQNDSLRIVESRRLRELREENVELRKQLVNKDREIDALKKRIARLATKLSDLGEG